MNHELICEKRTYNRDFAVHHHDFGQFLFPLQGALDIKTNDQKIKLESDHLFFLPPGLEHHYRSLDRNEFLILDVPADYLSDRTDELYVPLDQQWSAIRYLLLEEANKRHNSSLNELTRYIVSKLQTSHPMSIDYIHRHFKESIKLEKLAELEHYHPAYYSSWFKKQTGKNLKNYISDLRLKEAKLLLETTGWPMMQISGELGFENSSSFTRWFNNCTGVSPLNYRMLNQR